MDKVLEVKFEGWTATPRMPFILSGNAICLPVPTYSLILGIIGCCLGRIVETNEVNFGFHYEFESTATDLETRQRLEYDGKKVKKHSKGSDAYPREFHVNPLLTIWLDRIDWKENFIDPIGTPSLGRSQDILRITSVQQIVVNKIEEATVSGCMLPFNPSMKIAGQLVQLAEAYNENGEIGSGRISKTRLFIAVSKDTMAKIKMGNLYASDNRNFYIHTF